MTRYPALPDADRERLDLHNACIDQPTAAAGYCGTTDLAKGRICYSPAGHANGCDFRLAT
jgi:hypothetical protein